MSTQTAKKQASTAKSRSKRTAQTAKNNTQRTATQARAAGQAAQRTVKTVVTDAGYAAVGLSDTAIAFARTLPTKLQSVDTTKLVEDAPRKVEDRFETLRRNAEREFDVLAERGRNIVTTLSAKNTAGQRAAEQARTARQQLKAATTSLRKAVFSGAEAVESTVESAGRQAEREQYEAMTVAELQDIARRKGIENRSEKTKAQLVNALLSA
ncbi:MAG TPA: Rho termination factor N-terminal domain-containing protein [Egibacteraceae bacterium]|nr:Rho termination factor N-terminal domain-containing protein [Egibacteraceae bacterium]